MIEARTARAAVLAVVLTAVIGAPGAHATGAAVVFVAPFTENVTGLSALRSPCQINAAEPVTVTDPAGGSFGPLSAAIDVSGCSLHGVTSYYDWTLGDPLALFAGKPATVVALFELDGSAVAQGTGTLSSSLTVLLSDGSIEGPYETILSASCSGGGCTGMEQSGPFIASRRFESLPTTLHAVFRSDTHAENATGGATASVAGALRAVLVLPA